MMRWASISVGLVLVLAWVGCDYGVAYDEDPDFLDPVEESDDEFTSSEGALLGTMNTESLFKNLELAPRLQTIQVHFLSPSILDEPAEDDEAGDDATFCDCTAACNACMDAYICGHEAAIIQYCEECATCQKECVS